MVNIYRTGQIIHGFRVVSVQEESELQGRLLRMVHIRTGADLCWLDNGAENMVFSIAFRTLPHDSTGVFHILEHSVLCGSRDYPVREPFVELLKSSMNTFLNAMTFPDMTMFPVSSRNPRDLINLTKVYLDAVFHPIVSTDRKRFCQEGWHIDRDESGKPEFRGIVYNEMKGAMGDPETLMDRQIMRQLFPDTCYRHNSGGDPERITGLTFETFRKVYGKYYHPSNAYIYLDGAIDPDMMLDIIDKSFTGYKRRTVRPEFRFQEPVSSEKTIPYEIGPEEETRDRGYLTMARITGTWRDRADNLARSIICDVLTGSNEAPLKQAALERGLCRDLNLSVDDTGLQSWICIHADHVTDGREKDIVRLIEETGKRIAETGLDKDAAEASMNRMVFSLREDEEPQGISRCIRCMETWLYGGNPEDALLTRKTVREVHEMIENGEMNRLAADMLLNRNNMAVLHTLPSRTVGEENRKAEEARIHRITGEWSDTERKENDRLIVELEKWQNTPDDPQQLKKLPLLTREDADIVPEWTETEITEEDGIQILRHRIPCNGVVYLRAYFPLTGMSLEELTRAALFAGMMGRLPTRMHDAFSLQQEIKRLTGGMGFALMTRTPEGDDRHCTPYLTAYASALEEKAEDACRLMAEILTQTCAEGQDDRIRDMMVQNEIGARQRIVSAGHLIAVKSVLSRYSAEGTVRNAIDGEPAIRYIHRFAQNPEQEMEQFIHSAGRMIRERINRAGMIVSITGLCDVNLKSLKDAVPEGGTVSAAEYYSAFPPAAGYLIPAQIGFSARGYRLSRCGKAFSGIVWLAGSILSLEYLWNRVRVQGGSYGAGFQTDRNGNIFSYSYRDPTPWKTLSADRGASAFLRKFAENEKNIEKYIISSLNELNPLLSPREKGALADARIMTGITREETERIRQQILNTGKEDLIGCGEWLDRFAKEGSVCVAGPQRILKKCGDIEIRDL